jgi:hypothetical protein
LNDGEETGRGAEGLRGKGAEEKKVLRGKGGGSVIMHRGRYIIILIAFLSLGLMAADIPDREAGPVLESAEAFFKTMKSRDYVTVWLMLSARSQKTIAGDVLKSTKDSKESFTASAIEKDFASGGPIATAYWKAFLSNFDPDTVLEQSAWQMAALKRDTAEIDILYRKAEKPAKLKMFREGERWKVGLVETFWGRK